MSIDAPAGLSPELYERRVRAVHHLLEEEELDVLVLAASDYRGHKGALRWLADYNLSHRYGYAVVNPAQKPEIILPENLAMGRRGSVDVRTRYVRRVGDGIVAAVAAGGEPRRIGVVGLRDVMKVEDYLALSGAFPQAEIIDATTAFERKRAVKEPEELEGVREATVIAEECFARLLEVVRPGITERAVGAEMYARAALLGGEDFLFLTMYGIEGPDGRCSGSFGVPGDRTLERGDLFVFSFELVGRLGYWMEFARMVVLDEPTELHERLAAAVRSGMNAAAAAMVPGARADEVQRQLLAAVESEGARTTYWSGHGLGLDVIEEPWIGLDVVEDRDRPSDWELAANMVLSLHPYVTDPGERAIGYMANSYIVGEEGAEPVSTAPLDLYQVT